MDARRYDVVLHLLDHQIIDADGRLAGKVDDAEIVIGDDGDATLSALLSGPGVLAGRLGHHRFGAWRERMEQSLEPEGDRITRIPWALVRRVDQAVHLSLPAERLASSGTERWVRDHVIGRLPGANGRPT